MNLNAFDLTGIAVYFIAAGVFAYFVRRTKSFAEFAVGNRTIPRAMIFATMAATYIGPGFSVGFTAKGFSTGYVFYLLAMTYPIQMILVAFFFAPRLSRFRDCTTIGEVMAKRYGKFTHLLAGIVSVGLCIGFTAVMGKIAGHLLHSVTGLPLMVSIAIVTMFTALYTFTGGLRAVIATDALQFAWFSLVVPIALVIAFFKSPGTASEIAAKAGELTSSGFGGLSGIQILGIMVAFLLGETLIPPYANRALSAKTESASKQGFLWAGLYSIVWLGIVATLGIIAHQFLASSTNPDDVFFAMGKKLLPYGTYGLLLAGVIGIVMSSQDSVLNAAAVSFVRDIVAVRGGLSDKNSLILSRVGTILIAGIAIVVARYSPSIIEGLLICYSIWAPGLLLPFLLGLYLKRTTPMAGWFSMIAGATTSILWQTVLKSPGGYPAILVGLLASALAYIAGHYLGKTKTPTREVEVAQ